jgi:hypothetical protein
MTSWLKDISAGVLGAEMWGLLPLLSRAIIWLETLCLPHERRELRRKEWRAELDTHHDGRRIAGLLWAIGLARICVWERITSPTRPAPLAAAATIATAIRDATVSQTSPEDSFFAYFCMVYGLVAWMAACMLDTQLEKLVPILLLGACALFGVSLLLELRLLRSRGNSLHHFTRSLAMFFGLCVCTATQAVLLASPVASRLLPACASVLSIMLSLEIQTVILSNKKSLSECLADCLPMLGLICATSAMLAALMPLADASMFSPPT